MHDIANDVELEGEWVVDETDEEVKGNVVNVEARYDNVIQLTCYNFYLTLTKADTVKLVKVLQAKLKELN